MNKARRRQADHLRAEIMDGIAEYDEDRSSEARIARCGTLIEDGPFRRAMLDRLDRTRLCGMHADLALAFLTRRFDIDPSHVRPAPAVRVTPPAFLH